MFKVYICLVFVSSLSLVLGVQFEIANHDGGEIWIGIQGNSGKPSLENGGFKLGQGQTRTINAPDDWAGRFWSRQWCNAQTGQCLVGNCNGVECQGRGGAPPVTLVEITLRGHGDQDYYDISLVDGYSTHATIAPVNGQGNCQSIGCTGNINGVCPNELKYNTEHGVLGCKSSCLAFNTDQYCCRGNYGRPETCKPDTWPVNSARVFKQQCPQAYSYAYDDGSSTFTCKANLYRISFGG